MHNPIARTMLAGVGAIVALMLAGLLMPKWLLFLSTMAISHGMVSMGIVLLMRSGVVSFGQGFVFAAGGYAAALLARHAGISDALTLTLGGGAAEEPHRGRRVLQIIDLIAKARRWGGRDRHTSDAKDGAGTSSQANASG